MKKIRNILLACFFIVLTAGIASAYESGPSTGELVLGTKSGTESITVGLSPKVSAIYFTDGGEISTAQWYAIGAVHPGGTKIFASASDLNTIVSKEYTKGTTIDSDLFSLPANSVSASDWSESGGYKFN